jgi:hypothetical protein
MKMLILVDSGSSASFLIQEWAKQAKVQTQSAEPVQVSVANGAKLTSDQMVPDFSWLTQGNTFSTSVCILPLSCYDMILGMDWLESHSPMWIHWRCKIMRFHHKNRRISIHGLKPKTQSCIKISSKKLVGLMRKGGIAQLLQLSPVLKHKKEEVVLDTIQQLVHQFANIFQQPTKLPPQRTMNHHIPLLLGAIPVDVKPYRYSPAQKDEIESQLTEMLKNGIIQPSVSLFASPVLLVKKKDGFGASVWITDV